MRNICLLILLLWGFAYSICAQERWGLLENKKNDPIEYATIIFFKDSIQTATAVTDSMGQFTLRAEQGTYLMRVQCLGYTPLEQTVKISTAEQMGVFRMQESANELSEVVISASPISREADRFVMRISSAIPDFINKDATEVLQLAPGVWIDDNGISINGTSGTKVFINNRELKLSSGELAAYLRSFQSADIARIEVIPQAGAEYSADAKGGVIKIILKKRQENGVNGHAMMRSVQGRSEASYQPSATVNVLAGKWLWTGSANGKIQPKRKDILSENRIYPEGNNTQFESSTASSGKPKSGMGRFGVMFTPNTSHSIEAEGEYQYGRNKSHSYGHSALHSGGTDIYALSDYNRKDINRNAAGTLNYVYNLDSIGSALRLTADFVKKKTTENDVHQSEFQTSDNVSDSLYIYNASSDYEIFTADAGMEKILNSKAKLSGGVRYMHNTVNTHSLYEGFDGTAWQPLDDYSYTLKYVEHIGAAYATYNRTLGRFKLLAGLRMEHTRTTGKNTTHSSYTDAFPSMNLTYSFNEMQTFMLIGQYGRSIQRPNFWHLNSSRVQYSEYAYYIGNPLLRPTYIHRFMVTAVYNYRYTITIGGNLHKDLIREVTRIDPNNAEVKYVIPENHHTENHFFAHVSCPVRFANGWSLNNNLTGVIQGIKGQEGEKTDTHALYFINTTLNMILPAQFYAEVTYSGSSRLYSANSGIDPTHLLHITLKKRCLNDRLSVSVGVQNMFNSKTGYFAHMDSYRSASTQAGAGVDRNVQMSVQYTFNSGKKFNKTSNERSIDTERQRMEKATETK